MDQSKLRQRLLKTFFAELEEQVEEINHDLLTLERTGPADAGDEMVHRLFRAAHGLKGAARSVEIDVIESLCHAMEDLFSEVRSGRLGLLPEHMRLLFAAVDGLERFAEQVRAGKAGDEDRLRDLVIRLKSSCDLQPVPSEADGARDREADIAQRFAAASPERKRPAHQGASEAASAETNSSPVGASMDRTLRVEAEKLDKLIALSGELMVARQRAERRVEEMNDLAKLIAQCCADFNGREIEITGVPFSGAQEKTSVEKRIGDFFSAHGKRLSLVEQRVEAAARGLEFDNGALREIAIPIEQSVRAARMTSFKAACVRLHRAVRDLSQACSVKAKLEIEGEDIELDRAIIEGLKSPLLHLVRNAIDHGIEPPRERIALGKPEAGTIRVSARLRGARVAVSVSDDGRGVNTDRVRAKARAMNIDAPDIDSDLTRLICLPGLSTADRVTSVSGRGVGMDAVSRAVEAVHGSLQLQNAPGQGVCFTIDVPLTLTKLRAVLVRVGRHLYALDTANIARVFKFSVKDVAVVGGRDAVLINGDPVPIMPLGELIGTGKTPHFPDAPIDALLLEAGGQRALLSVDELAQEDEIIVKPLGPRIRRFANVAGATTLPDGTLSIILNASDLVAQAQRNISLYNYATADKSPSERRKRVIVADDTITTRTLETALIEAAGYDVVEAVDGAQAWHMLREQGADLVVTDIEMPKMDGFALTEAIRAAPAFRDIPVILVTSMDSDASRERGLKAGASAYIVKRTFDQRELLQAIERMI